MAIEATSRELITAIAASIAALAACIGAGIGIAQFVRDRRVRLRVTAKFHPSFYPETNPNSPLGYSIQVTNLSKFTVGISDVGFVLNDGQKFSVAPNAQPNIAGMPIRLDSRASHVFDFGMFGPDLSTDILSKVYATTECGSTEAAKIKI
jgi:hypothetical protein